MVPRYLFRNLAYSVYGFDITDTGTVPTPFKCDGGGNVFMDDSFHYPCATVAEKLSRAADGYLNGDTQCIKTSPTTLVALLPVRLALTGDLFLT